MSEIFETYHASNSIDVLASITRPFKTKQLNANQLNSTVIALNTSASNAEFYLFDKNMQNLIFLKRLIKIDLRTYINVYFKTYYRNSIDDHNLYTVMFDDFENFNIEI